MTNAKTKEATAIVIDGAYYMPENGIYKYYKARHTMSITFFAESFNTDKSNIVNEVSLKGFYGFFLHDRNLKPASTVKASYTVQGTYDLTKGLFSNARNAANNETAPTDKKAAELKAITDKINPYTWYDRDANY